jgi:hypothetical protein
MVNTAGVAASATEHGPSAAASARDRLPVVTVQHVETFRDRRGPFERRGSEEREPLRIVRIVLPAVPYRKSRS